MTSDDGVFVVVMERKEAIPLLKRLGDVSRRFAKITGMTAGSAPPVSVVSQEGGASGSAIGPRVDVLEGGQARVSVVLGNIHEIGGNDLAHLTTGLLLREHYGTSSPAPGSQVSTFPGWLSEGLARLCGSDDSPVGISFGDHAPPTLETFLASPPPEGNRSLRDLHERMSAFLVLAGLKESSVGFRGWIGPAESGSAPPVLPPWPPRWDMRSVEKRWTLLMSSASSGRDPGSAIPGPGESLATLDRIVGGGETFPALKDPGSLGVYGRDRLLESLSTLRLEANPMVLPLIERTRDLVARFPKIPRKRLDATVADLISERARLGRQASEVSSYLDWYEATRLGKWSGLFDGALSGNPDNSGKKGPVGAYLDRIESRGW